MYSSASRSSRDMSTLDANKGQTNHHRTRESDLGKEDLVRFKRKIKMYRGGIFVLLGDNGAGRTTSISILSGTMEPTNGSTSILGLDLQSELDEIRKSLGVCPQHNVLYDTMTVEEHMHIFAGLRGTGFPHTPSDDMKASVDIYTSEPTSGMDTFYRRFT